MKFAKLQIYEYIYFYFKLQNIIIINISYSKFTYLNQIIRIQNEYIFKISAFHNIIVSHLKMINYYFLQYYNFFQTFLNVYIWKWFVLIVSRSINKFIFLLINYPMNRSILYWNNRYSIINILQSKNIIKYNNIQKKFEQNLTHLNAQSRRIN